MSKPKELQAMITLMGKVSPTLSNAMQTAQQQSMRTSKSYNMMGKMAAKAGILIGAAFSISAIKRFGDESVQAAKKQIEAETKLEAVLKNVKSLQLQGPDAYKKATEQLKLMALQIQNVGVVGDEVSIAGYQQLATFQLSQYEIGVLAEGMGDLLAQQKGINASQEDAVGIANMMGKVMDGNVGALKRVGISFTPIQEKLLKTGNRMQRAAVLAEVLQQNVGGVNKALAETDQGKIKQAQNLWGDMQEKIGAKILPLQAKFFSLLASKIPVIEPLITGLIDKIEKGMSSAEPYVEKVFEHMGKAYEVASQVGKLIIDNWPMIEPILWGIVGAHLAWNLALKAALIIDALTRAWKFASIIIAMYKAGLSTATIAQWALNTAMAANPVTLIAIGIMLVIAAVVLLYKNWEKVWSFISNTAGKIKDFFSFKSKVEIETNSTIAEAKIPNMKGFARGGFTNQPSIFGEAGPEAAIPLQKSPRNIGLLAKTAGILGVQVYNPSSIGLDQMKYHKSRNLGLSDKTADAYGTQMYDPNSSIIGTALEPIPIKHNEPRNLSLKKINKGTETEQSGVSVVLNYNPTIHGSNANELEPLLQKHKFDLLQMIEEFFAEQRRVSFDNQ